MLLDVATEVDSQQAGPLQEHVPEKQASSNPTHLQILTGPGIHTGKIVHYQNKLVKFLDTLVTVAKSSYTLEQKGETSAKNLAFAKEILFAVEDVEERLEYLHLYGRKIIEEYQRNTQEQEQQTPQKQQSSASGAKNKAKVVRKKRHFHPEMKQEILKPYSGPDIVIDDDHTIVAKPMNESTRPQYK